MTSEIKQAAETVATHPKVSLAVTAAFTSNVWLDYGQPIIQSLTSIVGLGVVTLIFIKHFVDVKEIFQNWRDKKNSDKTN